MKYKYMSDRDLKTLHDMWSQHKEQLLWGNVDIFNVKHNSNRIVTAISINPENNNKHKTLDFNVL